MRYCIQLFLLLAAIATTGHVVWAGGHEDDKHPSRDESRKPLVVLIGYNP